jgi:membrane associated rhomboid family serine protease
MFSVHAFAAAGRSNDDDEIMFWKEGRRQHHPQHTPLPISTVLIILTHWAYFSYDIMHPTLPPTLPMYTNYWFQTIGAWSDCLDIRTLRALLTHQMVHADISHIIANHCLLILVGPFLEWHEGSIQTLAVYVMGTITGALCHTLVWPYKPLIGCSHGKGNIYTRTQLFIYLFIYVSYYY